MPLLSSFRSLSLLAALIFLSASVSWANNAMPWGEQEAERDAQEEESFDEQSAQEEMSSSIYGRITGLDMNQKVLFLLPTDQVENVEMEEDTGVNAQPYFFKRNTAITGLDSLNELSVGDYVNLEYYEFQDINRITEIVFDKHSSPENAPIPTKEETAEETKEAAPGVLVG